MLGSLSKGAVVCAVCLGFPGGSHLFRIGTSHPFLGIAHRVSNPNPDSMGYPEGFWGSLGVSPRVFWTLGNPRKPLTLGTSRTHTASFHPWETSPLISPHVQGYLTLVRKIPRILELPALPPGWKRLEVIHSSIQVLIESFWSPWKLSIEWLLTSYHAPLNQHFFIGFGFRSSKKDPLVSWMANFASLPFPFLHSTSPIYYWTASHPNLHGFQFNSLDYQINPFYYLSGFFI